MTEGAAALGFYLLLSLIPSLLIAGAVLNLLGREAAGDVIGWVRGEGASASLTATLRGMLDAAVESAPQTAGTVGLVGLGTLLYGASRAFTAAGRLLDVIAGVPAPRRPLLRRAEDLGWTVVLLVLMLVLGALVFVGGGLLRDALDAIGLDAVSTLAWDLARWPAALGLGLVVVGLVHYAAPTRRPAFRPVTPGGLFTTAAFLLASAGYGVYVGSIGNLNVTYGAFAALVMLLFWTWIAGLAFLFGAELDAEIGARGPVSGGAAAAGSGPARSARRPPRLRSPRR
jgi:membrane protein